MRLSLSPPLSDGVVLQRNRSIAIWGNAPAGETVTVTFLGEQASCIAHADGSWHIQLSERLAGGPYTMKITSGAETLTLREILIGDVWLCGGQSNMEFRMQRARHMFPEVMQTANNPFIRQFAVPQRFDFHGPSASLSGGKWDSVSPETIADFTAVGYFFAQRLFDRYRVPIGLLAAAVGGTPVHAWMSRSMLLDFPETLKIADKCADETYVESTTSRDMAYSSNYLAALDEADQGLSQSWSSPAYDDADWPERLLCAPFSDDLIAPGAIWFRKTVTVPPSLVGKPATLFLGTIIDADTVYANGVNIGGTTYRYPPREYAIDSLPQGRLTIAIRVLGHYGQCEFTKGKPRMLVCEGRTLDLTGAWKFRRGATCPPMIRPTVFGYQPTGFYNGMIAPLHRFPIQGTIWYQGESDTGSPAHYREKFSAMIRGWREAWGYDFPFLFTELAHYAETNGVDWDLLRAKQQKTLSIPATAMVFSQDIGEFNDLHPQNKQAVGDRLARVAMRLAYGEKLPASPFEACGEWDEGEDE